MKLLDRYVLRNFLEPFLICSFGFTAIWLIIDLSENGSAFLEAHASFWQIAQFYLTQLPATVLLALPIGLLLSLLFALTRMSRTNEIISMLAAGRSTLRLLAPLFATGLLLSGLCLWLNWEMAPHAEMVKKVAMKQISRGKKAGAMETIQGHLFRDRQSHRTWFVRRFRPGETVFTDVLITQQDAEGKITRKWYAARATHDARVQAWTLQRGMIVDFNAAGDIEKNDYFLNASRVITDWPETPWRIASSELEPQSLSIPELRDYLRMNADFPPALLAPYRATLADAFALPLTCLVVVCIAAPLGIVFNRRGVLGGVAVAISIFFALVLSRSLFLALGKGARLDPALAPWIPNTAIALIGLALLWMRAANRDLPSLFAKRK